MTVSSTTTKNSYSGNGSTTTFAYGFKIFADADLTVILRSAAGTETVQTITTHYTVTNAGNANGGNVVFGTAPASGVTVVIRRNIAQTQTTDYTANDPFPAESHEDALDRLTFITQQQQEELDRSIKLSRTNTMTSTEFTVGATDRANKILAFDSSGEISVTQELGTYKGTDATVTTEAYAVRDIIKSTTAAQLNNVYICVATSVVGDSLTDTDHFELLVDAVSAASSATTATTKAGEAASSATAAAGTLTTFQGQYHGAASSDPSSNLDAGDLYFNTSSGMKVYNGSAWVDVKPTDAEQTNINTVAGSNSEISALAASSVIADMALLGTSDVIADMALLGNSDVIADMALLATSDVIADMNTLATSDIVSDLNTLATSDIVSDINTLATSDIVSDLNALATSDIITDMNLLATSSVIADMASLAGSGANPNITTLTASGEIAAASLDISGNVDIDGTLEADAMTLNGTAITATATLSTGISSGNVATFGSGVADDDFLRVNGTTIEGRSVTELATDIGAATLDDATALAIALG